MKSIAAGHLVRMCGMVCGCLMLCRNAVMAENIQKEKTQGAGTNLSASVAIHSDADSVEAISLTQLFDDTIRHDGKIVVAGRITRIEADKDDPFDDKKYTYITLDLGEADKELGLWFETADYPDPTLLKTGQVVAARGTTVLISETSGTMNGILITNGFHILHWQKGARKMVLPDVLTLKEYYGQGLHVGTKLIKLKATLAGKLYVAGEILLHLDDGEGNTLPAHSTKLFDQKANAAKLKALKAEESITLRGRFFMENGAGALTMFVFDDIVEP